VNTTLGTATDSTGGADTFINIEDFIGTDLADHFTGKDTDASIPIEYNAAGIVSDNYELFIGLAGDDFIDGKGGYDEVSYTTSAIGLVIDLASSTQQDGLGGVDTLANIEGVEGTQYDDQIYGTDGDNSLDGRFGNNVIDGRLGFDFVEYNGEGRTQLTVNLDTGTASFIRASDGTGYTDSLLNIEGVVGSSTADSITGDDSDNRLYGSGGDDSIYGGDGNDLLDGGAGDDWLYGEGGDDQIDGGEGYDRVDFGDSTAAVNVNFSTGIATGASIGTDTLTSIEHAIGSNYNDVLTGSSSDEGFFGKLGDDSIDGGDGWDYVSYGRAVAAISVNLTTGVVTGGEGTDFLSNIEGIIGSNFGDTLIGSDNADWFRPDQVNDLHTPNYTVGGDDYMDGKEGVDRVSYYAYNAAVEGGTFTGISANLSTGVVIDELGNTDTVINIEDLVGSRYNDIIVGNDVDNVLDGRGGDDELTAGAGNDWIQAGDGDDSIHLVSTGVWSAQYSAQNMDTNVSYGTGEKVSIGGMLKHNHVLDGGLNNDILYLQDGNDAFFLDDMFGGFNAASLEAGQVGVGRIAGIEELRAGDGDDIIDLTSLVYGLVDNTSIYGEGGNDHLWAADGNDNIYGGDGNDSISGGAGNDVLSGGAGADKFQFTATSGADQIVDFQVSEGDELHFYYRASSVSDVNDLSMAGGVLTWATGDTGGFVTVDMSNTIVVDDVPIDLQAAIVFHEIV
jgi:Ca2+-binding RTX toxin-like protein